MDTSIESEWVSYWDSEDSRITTDLSLRGRAPIKTMPIVTRIAVEVKGNDNYFMTPEEGEKIDLAVAAIQRRVGMKPGLLQKLFGEGSNEQVYAGRTTKRGECSLYFYCERRLEKRIFVELERYLSGLAWTGGDHEDPTWDFYLTSLHPGAALKQLLLSSEQLEHRKARGDDLRVERNVDHTLLFRNREGRAKFCKLAATDSRWRESHEFEVSDVGAERKFGVHMTVHHAIIKNVSDSFVYTLTALAAQFDGVYDGWGAVLVSSTPSSASTKGLH